MKKFKLFTLLLLITHKLINFCLNIVKYGYANLISRKKEEIKSSSCKR
jgi:hypothetical protein